MSRIDLTDTLTSIVKKMSDNNPGAINAMMTILSEHDRIDPQAAMGGLGAILSLDTNEIYGTNIYILFSDKCGRDVRKMLMIMRATQLGFFTPLRLKEMAHDQTRQINLSKEEWASLDKQVCDRLEDFAKPPIAVQE